MRKSTHLRTNLFESDAGSDGEPDEEASQARADAGADGEGAAANPSEADSEAGPRGDVDSGLNSGAAEDENQPFPRPSQASIPTRLPAPLLLRLHEPQIRRTILATLPMLSNN
jgi:hypothetical protein